MVGRIFGMYTLVSILKNGKEHYILCDMQGSFAETRQGVQEFIDILQDSLTYITDEDIVQRNKEVLLRHDPRWFRDQYGEADSLYQAYKAKEALRPVKVVKHKSARKGFVYIIQGDSYYKIGLTDDPYKRLRPMTVKAPFPLKTLILIPTDNMKETEDDLHEQFVHKHVRGEWFNLDVNDLALIRQQYTILDPAILKAD